MWMNRTNVFRWYSWFWDGGQLADDDERDGRPKSTQTEVKIAPVDDLVKNDPQIASKMKAESQNIPKTAVLHIWKRIWETESCMHILFHIPWHLSQGKIESHLPKTLSWWVRHTKFFLTKRALVFCLWPQNKANVFWMGWWDIPLAEETEIPKLLRYQHGLESMLTIFFDSQAIVHKEIVADRKTVNAEFYKGIKDRLLKCIQRVQPAMFCSQDFFLLHNNAPTHKAASVCQFFTPQNVTTLYALYDPPCTLKIYLHQTIFCSPSWKWS